MTDQNNQNNNPDNFNPSDFPNIIRQKKPKSELIRISEEILRIFKKENLNPAEGYSILYNLAESFKDFVKKDGGIILIQDKNKDGEFEEEKQ